MGRSSCGSSSLANACCWRVPASLVRGHCGCQAEGWQGIRASGYCSACPGNLDPSRVPVTSDLPANETAEGTAVDPVVAVAYDRAVDVAGDSQDMRVAGCFECLFDRRGVESPESDIQGVAVTSVRIVVGPSPAWRTARALWVPITLSRPLTWCLLLGEGPQVRYLAAQEARSGIVSAPCQDDPPVWR